MSKAFLLTVLLMVSFSFSSCYKKLYDQSTNDKIMLLRDNQNLQAENRQVKTDNAGLVADNSSLKAEVERLKMQIEEQKKKTKKFSLFIRKLCCNETTNAGADEVYITVLATKVGSGDVFQRAPGDAAHWDMNDGGQPTDNPAGDSRCITDRTIFSGELKLNETYYLNVAVCEEDGGTTKKYQEAVAAVLAQTGDPFAVASSKVISVLTGLGLFGTDTDDWMGMFGVKVSNHDGILNTEWQAKGGIVYLNPDPEHPTETNRKEIKMNHDDSKYKGWFGVRY